MKQVSALGKWINEKHRSQVVFADKVGAHPTMVSRWLSGKEGISSDYQDKIRAMKYVGPWPREEALGVESAAGLSRNEITALQREVDLLRKDLKSAERVQGALIGAVRQLAKAAGLSHLAESLE